LPLPPLLVPDLPPLLRERDPFARELDLRGDLRAPELDDLADERLAPPVEDLARVVPDFFAPLERDEADVERLAAPPVERFAVERLAVVFRFAAPDEDDLRAPPERVLELLDDAPELLPLDEDISALHLPDMTRCAASATASAISDPSLVALAMTLLAARSAVSAASRPASRIFLRAPGLAAIAAAAAVNPAASISLLIAAFASLSTVDLLEPERDELPLERDDDDPREPADFDLEELLREEVLRVDLAIFYLPRSGKRHFRAVPVP
jgi:hypothetical protein